ncbi:MAG TPA: sigma-70 family RNA polymerase sigma factor [Kofleriaceae bacterium]|jgi:RNA polymerase sigma-70 factor (ECF subfamily)|nr:sigma-70 family RNA polymerase sigma factor [Kofleriaceae bacterium]
MAGDDIAELYRRHAPALQRRCASIVGNAEEARDLVQETFARYISAKSTFTDKASPFTMLYRIATNASIDRLRRRKTGGEDELDPEVQQGDLGNEPHRVDKLHDLALLTKGLTEEELTVAVLHHLDGYTQDGIASSLDISRKTVGKILAKFEDHVKKRAARLGYEGRASG